jgi:phosphoglycolate phosphatase-like HAD superfamily hydrolase
MKALIFDFDGTLADSFDTLLSIFEDITERESKLTPDEIADLRGKSLKEIIRYLKIKRWQIPRLVLKAKKQLAVRIVNIRLFPGVKQALTELSQENKIYILSTNSSNNIRLLLEKNKIDEIITGIYGDIGLRSKSSALKNLMKKEGLNRSECIYIGDEVRDIEAARKAKVKSAGVTWGFNNPDAIKMAKPDITIEKTRKLTKLSNS